MIIRARQEWLLYKHRGTGNYIWINQQENLKMSTNLQNTDAVSMTELHHRILDEWYILMDKHKFDFQEPGL